MKQFKRVLSLLVLFALVLTMFAASAFALNVKVTTTGKVNLRKGPGLGYKSVASLKKGKSVVATDFRFDDRDVAWYKVSYKGKTCWVSGRNIKAGSQSSYSKVVAAHGSTNIRSIPDLEGHHLVSIKKGTKVTFLNKTSVDDRGMIWYKVTYGGKTGWVSARYCELAK